MYTFGLCVWRFNWDRTEERHSTSREGCPLRHIMVDDLYTLQCLSVCPVIAAVPVAGAYPSFPSHTESIRGT